MSFLRKKAVLPIMQCGSEPPLRRSWMKPVLIPMYEAASFVESHIFSTGSTIIFFRGMAYNGFAVMTTEWLVKSADTLYFATPLRGSTRPRK